MRGSIFAGALVACLLAACESQQVLLDPIAPISSPSDFRISRSDRNDALQLAQAGDYDEQLCVTAQRMVLNSDAEDFTIHVQRGDGNAFHTIQMGVSPQAKIVRIAVTTMKSGPLGFDTHVACKMVNRDRVNDQLRLQLRGGEFACRDVNELTYVTALAALSPDERQRYLEEGKPLRFSDDFVTSGGGEWLPISIDDFIRDEPGQFIEIRAPSVRVPWNRSERVFHQGTQHCKLITLAAMQRWMRNGAFSDAAQLFPRTRLACTAPAEIQAGVGSCLFYFAPAQARICQDYNGSGWTADSARAACARRHATAAALAAAGNAYEGSGGVFSDVTCAERKDIAPIVGTCVFNCAAADESLWQISSEDAIDQTMTRACDLFIR